MTSKEDSVTNFRLKYDNSVNPTILKFKMDTSQQFTKTKKTANGVWWFAFSPTNWCSHLFTLFQRVYKLNGWASLTDFCHLSLNQNWQNPNFLAVRCCFSTCYLPINCSSNKWKLRMFFRNLNNEVDHRVKYLNIFFKCYCNKRNKSN